MARVYAYDDNGSRLSVTEGAAVISGSYDTQDRLETYGTKTYTYSAGGDLEKVEDSAAPPGDLDTLYTYDALGNLTQVDPRDGRIISYVIDGQNRRVGKKVDGILVQGWLYQDQLNPVAELDGAGNVVASFVYGTRPNVPDYMVKGITTYRILSDHLGSPRLVIDEATGTVAQRLDYDEFGQVTQDTNVGFQPFGFAGGLFDADTGLVRFGARDYDAEVGRWTTRDPIRFDSGGVNLFAYALSNPIRFLDSNGLAPFVNNSGTPVKVSGNAGSGNGVGPQQTFVVQPGQRVSATSPVQTPTGPVGDVDFIDFNGDGVVDQTPGLPGLPPFGEKVPGDDKGIIGGKGAIAASEPCGGGPPQFFVVP